MDTKKDSNGWGGSFDKGEHFNWFTTAGEIILQIQAGLKRESITVV